MGALDESVVGKTHIVSGAFSVMVAASTHPQPLFIHDFARATSSFEK
jgi:hypothetical protein